MGEFDRPLDQIGLEVPTLHDEMKMHLGEDFGVFLCAFRFQGDFAAANVLPAFTQYDHTS